MFAQLILTRASQPSSEREKKKLETLFFVLIPTDIDYVFVCDTFSISLIKYNQHLNPTTCSRTGRKITCHIKMLEGKMTSTSESEPHKHTHAHTVHAHSYQCTQPHKRITCTHDTTKHQLIHTPESSTIPSYRTKRVNVILRFSSYS